MPGSPKSSSSAPRILIVAGARPNFMKIAPILKEIRSRDDVDATLVHTGQHYDDRMSASFFRALGIPEPDHNLSVGSGTHGEQTAAVLTKIERLLIDEPPAAVLVVGDVNSTIAAALAAVKLGIPVAHVEAGLRAGDRAMPEEINRILTDAISDWLFTTERSGDENLQREGIPAERIHFVGNVMIDTLMANLERARELSTLEDFELEPQAYGLLTLHRPSNVDDPTVLSRLFSALEKIHADVPILFPTHPRTRSAISSLLGGETPALRMVEPIGYLDFLNLMANARLVLTDSGGIQEETTALGTPCLTLRENTERPITLTEGTNVLCGTDPDRILAAAREIIDVGGRKGSRPEFWDGQASKRIVDVLVESLEARA